MKHVLRTAYLVINSVFFSFLLLSSNSYASENAEQQLIANEHYEKALISFDDEDYKTTMIHLKNTFKNQRDHLAGRILYVNVLLAHDNGIAAEVELDYAKELGADLDLIRPLKAKALLFQQRYNDVLEVTTPSKRGIALETELAYFRGQAYLGLRKFVYAEESFEQALQLSPNHNLANLGKAQVFLARKQFDLAEQYTEKALKGYNIPQNARLIRAKLYLIKGETDAAIKQLNTAIALEPNGLSARMVRAEVLLSQGSIEKAEDDINYILDRAPKEPQTNYLKVIASSQKGNTEQISETFSKILGTLNTLPNEIKQDNPQYLYLAGYILYKQNSLVESANFFKQYLDRVNDYRAIIMLAEIEITQQEYKSAKNLLTKANRNFPNNEAILNLLAQSYIGIEQYENAQHYLVESLQINANNPNVVLLYAHTFIAQKKFNKAIELLLKIELSFPNMVPALIALNRSFEYQKNYTQALIRSEKLTAIAPNNSRFRYLHGKNLMLDEQLLLAENSFKKAITLFENNVAAKIALTDILLKQEDTIKAKEKLDTLLIEYPKNVDVMLATARLHHSLKQNSQAILWFEKVLAEDKTNIDAFIALEKIYRKSEQLNNIQTKLENALKSKSIAKLHELLGGVYLSQRKFIQAIKQYESFVNVADNRGYALSILANAQITARDINGAISSLKKALVWDNEIIATHILLTKLLMASGDLEQAGLQLDLIRSKTNSGTIADLLEGDLLYKQKRYKEALSFYLKSYKINPSTASILALYRTYKKQNKLKKAEELLVLQFEDNKPIKLKLIIALADIYQSSKQYEKAVETYQLAMKSFPNSPVLLNNLANTLIAQGKNKTANSYALQAVVISPNNVTILDTLALTLMKLNNYEEALINLRKGLAIDAENSSVKYHLAITLDKLGRRKSAKNYLIQIIESPTPSKQKLQATNLLDSWLANNG